eukprot:gene9352-biopygen4472
MRLLEDQRKDVITVRDARGFMEGPLSLCIQHKLLRILGTRQYISTQQDLGQLVLTVFGMGRDLLKFFVVFMVSIAGFGIAFHGMFAYTPSVDDTRNFHTVEGTVYTLFDAALGNL